MENTGERLKKIRLERGVSLEEAHKKTKINLNILKAIEEGSISGIDPIYLKGFLKIYCNFLGVNSSEFSAPYKETPVQPEKQIITEKKPANPIKLNLWKPSKTMIKIALLVIAFIVFSMLLFNLVKFISSKIKARKVAKVSTVAAKIEPKKGKKSTKVAAKTAAVPAAPLKLPQAQPSKASKEIFSGIRLGIRAKENCWLQLKADGRVLFQRVLEKGRFESWQAKDKIELSLGNAGAVELEVNGQLFSNLGRRGQALKGIVITKDGLQVKK